MAAFGATVETAAASAVLAVLGALATDDALPVLLVAYAVFDVGLGSIGAPVNTTAIAGMPRSQASLAAAVAPRQAGAVGGFDAPAGERSGNGVAIVVLGLVSTGARARTSAERVASLLAAP